MILFLIGVAFLLRTTTLTNQSLWRDEVDAIRFSSWSVRDLVGGLFLTGHNGPLYFLLLNPWRDLMGDSEFALRFPSAVFGTLVVALGYVLMRQLGFGRRSGVVLGLLFATSPYLIWYGQEAKMYAMLLAVITLAMIAYLRALAGRGITWWIVFVVSTSLSFYLHILAPLMLGVYGIVAFLRPEKIRHHWRTWLISMACLTLPYLPLVLWQLPVLIEGGNLGHPFYPLRQELFILLQLYSGGLFRSLKITPIVLFVFLFLCGLLVKSQTKSVRASSFPPRLLLAVWTLFPPLAIYVISLRVPVFEDRYLIYITPAFYGMIVLGLMAVRQYSRSIAALCLGIILMTNLIGVWQQQHQPVKADFRAAAAYLTAEAPRPATIMIQMPYLQHTFKYYYPKKYRLIEGLWTNDGKSEMVVDTEMRQLTRNLSELWFVVSEEESWDQRRLVRKWLDSNADLIDEVRFTRVDVYRYQFRPGAIETESIETQSPGQ
ncbi:MAG: glycosyltransferase family 39 protein [Anaerolineae bacterium]|nr:glycosyltransferase family 39 protein [Anaerolineae bacterium]